MIQPKFILRHYFLFTFLLFLTWSPPAIAEEVITSPLQSWAQKIIKNEEELITKPEEKTLAVLYFNNLTGHAALDPIQKGLTYMLITDLSRLNDIKLIERVRLQAIIQELNLRISELVIVDEAPRVGKLMGATYLIGGNIVKGDKKGFKIESDLLDISSQTTIGSPSIKGNLKDIIRIEKVLLFNIIKLLRIQLTDEEKKRVNEPITNSSEALFAFFYGLQKSDEGNYDEAANFYERALSEDPDFKYANLNLNELRVKRLIQRNRKSVRVLSALKSRISLTNKLGWQQSLKRSSRPNQLNISAPSTVIVGWQ